MIRVVHLISGLNIGGAERVLANLVRGCDRSRFRHAVVSMIEPGPVGMELAAAGVEIHGLGMRPGRASPAGFLRYVRILRRLRPQVLHCWMYHANLLGLLAGKIARVPHTIWGTRSSNLGLDAFPRLTRWVVHLNACFSSMVDVIAVNSKAGAHVHQLLGYDTSKMVVIPNGFDLDLFRPDPGARRLLRSELGVSEDTLLIGLIARFHPMKDHRTFFKAAGLLARCKPDVHFLLAGEGITPENQTLFQMVQGNGLDGRADLFGPRDDIARVTAALDVASLSSWSEGFPNVVGEAMACAVPCVVTDVGDAAYIVGDTGRVVPPRNPEAMSAAWAELIEMGPEGRHALGQKARRRIEENFTLAKMVRAYESLYERIADWV